MEEKRSAVRPSLFSALQKLSRVGSFRMISPLCFLAFVATLCATANAVGVSSKVDLPGIVRPRRPLGTDILDPEKVQAILQVQVKSARPDNSDTKVNAVVCLNSDSSKCDSKEVPGLRPAINIDSEEQNDSAEDTSSDIEKEQYASEEEEQEVKKHKRKQVIVIVDESHPVPDEKKKTKKKKVPDVPVVVGYAGVTSEEESKFQDNIHIAPVHHGYNSDQSIQDVPIYTGLNLRPEFDKSQDRFSYINPPRKDATSVTYKQVPFGFDESALVQHIFETSPLIKALQNNYNPMVHRSGNNGIASFNRRVAVSDIPDYVAGLDRIYHHQPSVPGFYGGHQPRIYPSRGIVRPGSQGCYYPSPKVWTPSVHGKVAFTGEEEDVIHYGSGSPTDSDSAGASDTPVIKVDGKLGGPLEGTKT